MRKLILFMSFLLVLVPLTTFADSSTATGLVESGLSAYLKDGPDAAIKAWLQGSGMEGNTQALTQANNLRQIEDFYGKPESFDIVKENEISPRSRMVIFAINHAKGIVFGRFQAYQVKSGNWVSTELKFHSEAASVLPADIVFGK